MKRIYLIKCLFISVISILIIGMGGCETESIISEEVEDIQFSKLVDQYKLTYEILDFSKNQDTYIADQIISVSELELILSSLQKLKNSTIPVENALFSEFTIPRLRSSDPENNENVNTACVSRSPKFDYILLNNRCF